MQNEVIRLAIVGESGTTASFARRLQLGGLQRLEWPAKHSAMGVPDTRSAARVRRQTQSLAALEAENTMLRSRVVELALQIQALTD